MPTIAVPQSVSYRETLNMPRRGPGRPNFYEVYFVKWYDPQRQQVGWVRYIAIDSTFREPEATVWGALIDRNDPSRNVAIRERFPISAWEADSDRFGLKVGASGMTQGHAWGDIQSGGRRVAWDVRAADEGLMVEHVPRLLRDSPLLATKFAAPYCWVTLDGHMTIDGQRIELSGVRGNQAHFWGPRQVERWYWANCSTFREDAGFAFDMVVGIMKEGLPGLTCLFFHWEGQLYEFNELFPALFGYKSHNDFKTWTFEAARGDLRFVGEMRSDPADMIVYRHDDPDGGVRHGHVNYMADCTIHVERKQGGRWNRVATFTAEQSATFEVGQQAHDPRAPWLIR